MKTLKVEEVYLAGYETFEDVAARLPRFIDDVYNAKKNALVYRLPVTKCLRGKTRPASSLKEFDSQLSSPRGFTPVCRPDYWNKSVTWQCHGAPHKGNRAHSLKNSAGFPAGQHHQVRHAFGPGRQGRSRA
jgi:hypothetical protein